MAPQVQSGSVLVLDADPNILIFIGRLLEQHGMRTLFARNANEAIVICARTYVPIDLILANVTLPELSGPETVNRVRELRPELPALYMSARIDDGMIRIDVMQRDSGVQDDSGSKTLFETICEAIVSPRTFTAGH